MSCCKKNDRIVLRASGVDACRGDTIRLTPEAVAVVSRLVRKTGLSARHIVSEILIQSENLIDIVCLEDGD